MAKKKPLQFDCVAGSQRRDSQGEMLSVEGADISEIEQGRGKVNDNHGLGFYNNIGRLHSAKKIFKIEDCENDRQKYYWEKIQAPYIYMVGSLFDDEDHPNSKAAAAILRSIHKTDSPLKVKCSVEGGVIARGISDATLLSRTKINAIALTFTPANNATLVEPLNLDKSDTWEKDKHIINSVMHLAKTDVPSFRHITRNATADKIIDNFCNINQMAEQLGLKSRVEWESRNDLIKGAIEFKLKKNIEKIKDILAIAKLEKASKQQLKQMLGNDPKHDEAINWARKNLGRDDLVMWFMKNYKKDPSIFNKDNQEKLTHYMGMQHLDSVKNHRMDPHASFEDGVKSLESAEQTGLKAQEGKTHLISEEKSPGTMFKDVGNGMAWYSLGKGSCSEEGKAMGHCGNAGNSEDDNLLSLRSKHTYNGKTFYEPHATFVENQGYIGESKGKQNDKPAPKYHDAIEKLLLDDRIKGNIGGGYAPQNNFALHDMSKQQQDRILAAKPNVEPILGSNNKLDKSTFPEKHHDSVNLHNSYIDAKKKGVKGIDLVNHIAKKLKVSEDTDVFFSAPIIKLINHEMDNGSLTKNDIYSNKDIKHHRCILSSLLMTNHADGKDVDRALSDKDSSVREAAVSSPHFKPEHMERALSDKDSSVRLAAVYSPHFKPEHMERALSDSEESVRAAAVRSPHFKPEHTERALSDKDWFVRSAAVSSPHFKPEHMDRALSDKHSFVRSAAVSSPHFKPEHMDRALSDKHSSVRSAVVYSSHFKPEDMERALSDKDSNVRSAAVRSPHVKPEHMERALSDSEESVRLAAVYSPHFKPEHMERALSNNNWSVRLGAVRSSHFKPEHMDRALSDSEESVRATAKKRQKEFKLKKNIEKIKDILAIAKLEKARPSATISYYDIGEGTSSYTGKDALHAKKDIVKELIDSKSYNGKAYKNMPNFETGKNELHFLVHRGLSGKADREGGDNKFLVNEDHIEQPGNAIHTLNPTVAHEYTGPNDEGEVHSFWVPISKANAMARYHVSGAKNPAEKFSGFTAQDGSVISPEEVRIESSENAHATEQQHISIGPGKFRRATEQDLKDLDRSRGPINPSASLPYGAKYKDSSLFHPYGQDHKFAFPKLKKDTGISEQHPLIKGSMRRIAKNPQYQHHQFVDSTYYPSDDKSAIKRGQVEFVKQLIAKGNKHAYKNIDGKLHVLLHRGIDPKLNIDTHRKMSISSDGSLNHKEHGMYTDNHEYASQFAGTGGIAGLAAEISGKPSEGKVHSVWVPIDNINRNAQFEHNSAKKKQINTNPEAKAMYEDDNYDYDEIEGRENHVLVNPGSYTHASQKELKHYLDNEQSADKINQPALGSMNVDEGSMTGEGDALPIKWQGSDPKHAVKDTDYGGSRVTRSGIPHMIVDPNSKKKIVGVTAGVSDLGYDRIETGLPVKLSRNIKKALTAGYGGAGSPTSMTGGSVIQSESLDASRPGFRYITCNQCGDEQVYMKHQCKCRNCNKHFSFDTLARFLSLDK